MSLIYPRTQLFIWAYGLITLGHAQWSTDPAGPLVICNADGYQQRPEVISDGGSGWFVIWSDERNGYHEVYGQRVDSAGMALWQPNGKLLVSAPDSNIYFKCPLLMEDGSFMLAYSITASSWDVLNVDRFDANGEPLWDAPVRLADPGPGSLGDLRRFKRITGVRNGAEAVFAWMYEELFGIGGPYAFERIAMDGSTQFGQPGMGLPNSGSGQMEVFIDHNDGIIFHWQNIPFSIASPLLTMRVNANGIPVWSQNQVLSQASNMLHRFSTVADNNGNFYTTWTDSNLDVRLAATDTSGQFTWDPTYRLVCLLAADQYYVETLLHDQQLFVAWSDERVPANNMDLYMQGYDLSGEALWSTNGLPIIQATSEYPQSALVPSSNGSVIAAFPATDPGFLAMRVLPDGSRAWPAPVQFCTSDFNPYGLNFKVLPEGQGGAVAFWQTSSGDLFAARIDPAGYVGPTAFSEQHHTAFTMHPNPAHTTVGFRWPSMRLGVANISIFDQSGRAVLQSSHTAPGALLDVSTLSNGIYAVAVVQDGVRLVTQRLVVQH